MISKHKEHEEIVLGYIYAHPEGVIRNELLKACGIPIMSLTRTLQRMVDDGTLNKNSGRVSKGKKRANVHFYTLGNWDGTRHKYKYKVNRPKGWQVGRKLSQETKDKIAAAQRKVKHKSPSAETRRKISEARRRYLAKKRLAEDEYAEWDVVDVDHIVFPMNTKIIPRDLRGYEIPEVPASFNTPSSLLDRVCIVSEEEWARLSR